MDIDATIIGGGPAGYTAAVRIAQLGGRAVVIEKEKLGGVCANTGCIPTKTMQASIRAIVGLERARKRGAKYEKVRTEYDEIILRTRKVVGITVRGIERLLESYDIPVIEGEGKIASRNAVEVSSGSQRKRLKAKNIVIATGSLPQVIQGLKPDGERVLTIDDILALKRPPESLVIVGGGAVGVEYATIFNALGTKTMILEMMDRLLPSEDWEVSEVLQKIMRRRGMEIETGSRVDGLDKDGLKINGVGGTRKVEAEKILVAAGRSPRFRPEELLRLGIRFAAHGIEVDGRMETSAKGIYAVGDVTGPPYLAHAAYAEGLVCAENIMGREATIDLGSVPSCIYTIPEAASIGVRTNSKEEERKFKCGRSLFSANGEARAKGETEGFVKVLVDRKSNALIGTHIVGPGATEIIAAATLAITIGATADRTKETIIAHPTLAETFIEAVRDADREALHALRG